MRAFVPSHESSQLEPRRDEELRRKQRKRAQKNNRQFLSHHENPRVFKGAPRAQCYHSPREGYNPAPGNRRGKGAPFWYDSRAKAGSPPGRKTRRQGAREHRTPLTDFKENAGIAATFTEMGRLLELSADEPARVRAFLRVADILLTSAESVGVLAREGRLRALPGISAAAERIILEWLETGRVEQLERLRLRVPETVLDLLDVEVLTPAQVRTLSMEHGIASA